MASLDGVNILHLASMGPGPFGAMLLADLGANVVVIDRVKDAFTPSSPHDVDPRRRGQRSIRIDFKSPESRPVIESVFRWADVFIEGMRPGAAERIGIGPDRCTKINPRLIYARMTGWGQEGPRARQAGHDINYIASTGALRAMGPADSPPPPPLNLLGDYGGGGTYLTIGILAALIDRDRTGTGDVLDVAIIDGVASLTAPAFGMIAANAWDDRGRNLFDGSVPYYRTYETSDHEFMAVGAIEGQFYVELLRGLDLEPSEWPQEDRDRWPALRDEMERRFRGHPRSYWTGVFDGTDACVSPVLSFTEAEEDPHNVARGVYREVNGATQPSAAPRFRNSVTPVPSGSPLSGEHTDEFLSEIGFAPVQISELRERGVVR